MVIGSSSRGCSFQIPTEKVEITVDGGNFMSIDNPSQYQITNDGQPGEWYQPPLFASSGDAGRDSGHLTELADFVSALRDKRKTNYSSIDHSYRSMVLYQAMATSAAQNAPVDIRYETI